MTEPARTAELRGTLEAVTERAAVSGAGLTEAGMDFVLVHIEASYQRGLTAGRSQSGYAARRTGGELMGCPFCKRAYPCIRPPRRRP